MMLNVGGKAVHEMMQEEQKWASGMNPIEIEPGFGECFAEELGNALEFVRAQNFKRKKRIILPNFLDEDLWKALFLPATAQSMDLGGADKEESWMAYLSPPEGQGGKMQAVPSCT